MSSSLASLKKEVQSTDRLTPTKKYQAILTFYFTGEKNSLLPNSFRSGDEWHVSTDLAGGNFVAVKAPVVGDNSTPLTSTDWKYNESTRQKKDTKNFELDPTLICTLPEDSPPCSVRLTLRGLAKDIQGKCQGLYKEFRGLRSMGRKVNVVLAICHLIVNV